MQKYIVLAFMLFTSLAFAGSKTIVQLVVTNYFQAGNIYLGTSPKVIGPATNGGGTPVSWSPQVNGNQAIGLQSGSTVYPCYVNSVPLTINSALYNGKAITVIFGQAQYPAGIACDCNGAGCVY